MHDDDLARVFGAGVFGGNHGLGQSHTLRPRDNMIPDLAIDGDTGPLSLLHPRDALLLAGEKGGPRLRAGLALGDAAAERGRDERQKAAQSGKETTGVGVSPAERGSGLRILYCGRDAR
jgi:hypothetical protein